MRATLNRSYSRDASRQRTARTPRTPRTSRTPTNTPGKHLKIIPEPPFVPKVHLRTIPIERHSLMNLILVRDFEQRQKKQDPDCKQGYEASIYFREEISGSEHNRLRSIHSDFTSSIEACHMGLENIFINPRDSDFMHTIQYILSNEHV